MSDLTASPSGQRSGSVLLIDPDPAHSRSLVPLIAPAVDDLVVATAPGAAPVSGRFDVVVAHFDGLGADQRQDVLEQFAGEEERGKLLVVLGGCASSDTAGLLTSSRLTHILAKADEVDADELRVTIGKILGDDVFGLDKYFPQPSLARELCVTRSTERQLVHEALEEACEELGVRRRMRNLVQTAIDELVTNALYNAPVDNEGNHRFAALPRTQPVELDASEAVRVRLASDGRRLGLSVGDAFGSLTVDTVRAYLARCFRGGADQIEDKEGGAGLGLFYVFEAVSNFIVNLEPGRMTEIICIVDCHQAFREHLQRQKSFHVFLKAAPAEPV